jgi:hypothetical protein
VHETFWTLLRDHAHWEFEMFLMLLFDVFLAGAWQLYRRHRQNKISNSHTYHYTLETPKGICEDCGGLVKHLIESGVRICLGCGNLDVLK